jgi:hypothetical protein
MSTSRQSRLAARPDRGDQGLRLGSIEPAVPEVDDGEFIVDALAICLALLDREPETYPRAAAK